MFCHYLFLPPLIKDLKQFVCITGREFAFVLGKYFLPKNYFSVTFVRVLLICQQCLLEHRWSILNSFIHLNDVCLLIFKQMDNLGRLMSNSKLSLMYG